MSYDHLIINGDMLDKLQQVDSSVASTPSTTITNGHKIQFYDDSYRNSKEDSEASESDTDQTFSGNDDWSAASAEDAM